MRNSTNTITADAREFADKYAIAGTEFHTRIESAFIAEETVTRPHSLYTGQHGATTCKCGREFRTSRALGLHLGAITRAGRKAYSGAYDAFVR